MKSDIVWQTWNIGNKAARLGPARACCVVQSEYGDLYKVTVSADGANKGTVTELKIKYFDTLPPCTSVCVLRTGFLFAASEFGNHALYQFQVSIQPLYCPPAIRMHHLHIYCKLKALGFCFPHPTIRINTHCSICSSSVLLRLAAGPTHIVLVDKYHAMLLWHNNSNMLSCVGNCCGSRCDVVSPLHAEYW